MSRYWSPALADLSPYVPGEQPRIQNLTKLNTNELPFGPSPRVLAALRDAIDERLRLYPDPDSRALKTALARRHGLDPAHVFVGNGSDEVLAHAFCAFFRQPHPVLFADITYSFYPVYCQLYGIRLRTVPLDSELRLHIEDFLPDAHLDDNHASAAGANVEGIPPAAEPPQGGRAPLGGEESASRAHAAGTNVGGILIANPNAPTGQLLPLTDIDRLARARRECVVLIDEAYIDFGGESAVSLVRQHPNLLVVQTLSKSRGGAGLRVGWAFGSPELIDGLERVKNSFNSYPLDRLAQTAAFAALEDEDWFDRYRRIVIDNRQWLADELTRRGYTVLPSAANFLFVRPPQGNAAEIAQHLRDRAVLVRHFKTPDRIAPWLRISIGTRQECETLLAALDA